MKDNYYILLMNIGARHRKIATLQVGSWFVGFPCLNAKKRYTIAIEVDCRKTWYEGMDSPKFLKTENYKAMRGGTYEFLLTLYYPITTSYEVVKYYGKS